MVPVAGSGKQERRTLIATSLKMYFGHRQTRDWVGAIAHIAGGHPAVRSGAVELAVLPSFPVLESTGAALAATPVRFGAQNLAIADRGAYTGEVGGPMLAELGCTYVEIGHAERRELFGETDDIVRTKVAAAYRARLTPILCVGETAPGTVEDAVELCRRQIVDAIDGADGADGADSTGGANGEEGTAGVLPLVVAYEPRWAIGAEEPAEPEFIRAVCAGLQAVVRELSTVDGRIIYGGSARVGLLSQLGGDVDGLFLGRFAHDPEAVRKIVDEAGATHGS